MLLAGVLFLTGVWHESVLTAGLMLFPGPAMATAFSVPSARLGARVGYRIPGCIGSVMFAAASVWCHTLGPSRSSMTARIGVPCARIRSIAWATSSPTIASPGR